MNLKTLYLQYPKRFWVIFFLIFWAVLIYQSYLAAPRPLTSLMRDTGEFSFLILALIFLFFNGNSKYFLPFGLLFFIISLVMYFGGFRFIKVEYGTLFFVLSLWLLGDFGNYKYFGKNIFTELITGNYYMASGIFISTVLVGGLVELINVPFRIWWYSWPFPSLMIGGTPIFMVAFGWLPWILAMFVFLYPWTLQKPKELS